MGGGQAELMVVNWARSARTDLFVSAKWYLIIELSFIKLWWNRTPGDNSMAAADRAWSKEINYCTNFNR